MAHRRGCTDEEIREFLARSDSDSECGIFNDCSDDEDSSEESCSNIPPRTSPSRARQDSSSSSESENESIRKRPRLNDKFDWQKRDFNPALHSFDDSASGHNCKLASDSSILSFFMLFLSENLMEFIALETNRFFTYTMANTSESVHSRLSTWKDTGFEELYCFIGIWLLMARVKKLRIREYWSRDVLLSTPIFGEVMSRDRFMLLLRMLHFSDNSANRGNDSLFKIRKIIDTVRMAFRSAFNPYQKLCIDESLLLFKGRLSFKQFIPSKRSRFGIKTFVLCDCKTGYVLDFIVYTGITTEIEVHNLGKSGDIVATLMKPYCERGHTMYVDNWYTSPDLFLWLHNHRTAACGTVRSNRRNLPKLQNKLKRGEIEFMSTDTMLAIKWCDRREVFMLTTCNTTEMCDTGKTNRKTGEKVLKPQCVVDYNASMGAVDRSDMLLSSVGSVRKSVKWYKKFFFHVVDLCVLNAHTLHRSVTGRNIPLADFHLCLVRELLEKFASERRRDRKGRRSDDENPLRLTGRHFPNVIPSDQTKKRVLWRRCAVCSKRNVRRETKYECKTCNVPLCVVPCFGTYHTKKNF